VSLTLATSKKTLQ